MIERVGVVAVVGNEDIVERGGGAMGVVVTVEGDFSAAGDANVAEGDIAEDREQIALHRACLSVRGAEDDRVGRVANADVIVDDILNEAATGGVGFDADGVVGAVEGEVGDADLADAAVGFRADGHAVSPVEMVVDDGHVGDPAGTAFDGDVVVAGADVAVDDGDDF